MARSAKRHSRIPAHYSPDKSLLTRGTISAETRDLSTMPRNSVQVKQELHFADSVRSSANLFLLIQREFVFNGLYPRLETGAQIKAVAGATPRDLQLFYRRF